MTVAQAMTILHGLYGDSPEAYGISFSTYIIKGQQRTRFLFQVPDLDRHDVHAHMEANNREVDAGWDDLDEMIAFIQGTRAAKASRAVSAVDATAEIAVQAPAKREG